MKGRRRSLAILLSAMLAAGLAAVASAQVKTSAGFEGKVLATLQEATPETCRKACEDQKACTGWANTVTVTGIRGTGKSPTVCTLYGGDLKEAAASPTTTSCRNPCETTLAAKPSTLGANVKPPERGLPPKTPPANSEQYATNRQALGGDSGAPKLTGYVIVPGQPSSANGGEIRSSADCPAGKIAYSAGFKLGSGMSFLSWIESNYLLTPPGQRAVSQGRTVEPAGSQIQTFAICADPIANLRAPLVRLVRPAAGQPLVDASLACAAGDVIVGAGFDAIQTFAYSFGPSGNASALGAGGWQMQVVAPVSFTALSAKTTLLCAPKASVPPLVYVESKSERIAGQSSYPLRAQCPPGHKPLFGGVINENPATFGFHESAIISAIVPDEEGISVQVRNRSIISSTNFTAKATAVCAPFQ